MLEKAESHGYKRVGFILDRGYFSRKNIEAMDEKGYDFIMMVKGMVDFISSTVLENKGRFEDQWEHFVDEYELYGIIVKKRLFATDEKDRYIYFTVMAERQLRQRRHNSVS